MRTLNTYTPSIPNEDALPITLFLMDGMSETSSSQSRLLPIQLVGRKSLTMLALNPL